MKTMKFSTAVIFAMQDLLKDQLSFSIFEITKRLRELANYGELALSDVPNLEDDGEEVVAGAKPSNKRYLIPHDDVKEIFLDLYNNGVFPELKVSDNGSYRVFTLCEDEDKDVSCLCKSYTTNPVVDSNITYPDVNVAPAVANVADATVLKAKPSDTNFDVEVDQTALYLFNRQGEKVTMKEIQSRLKGRKTCKEIADMVASMGYPVNSLGEYPSKWTVTV